jgi:uncharacterized protein YbjT (DUF2867 family)
MNVILFGATGMVGQGVLRECIEDPRIDRILLVTRQTTAATSPKITELIHQDFYNWTSIEDEFDHYDACFFSLGISSVGRKEADYRRTTFDLTLNIANVLVRHGIKTFIYVSGQNTNTHSRSMWARVKGATEDALFQLPFAHVYCFRPGYIQPLHGVRSKVGWYNAIYIALSWTYPLLRRVAAPYVTSTEDIGRAMISVASLGYPRQILENRDITIAAQRPPK